MSNKNKDKTPDELRAPLLKATLTHVPFDGWSKKSTDQAAIDIGVDKGIVDLAFPHGSIDMITLHAKNCDDQMIEAIDKINMEKLKIREKITALVKIRIQVELPHKEAAHRTISFLGLPKNHFASLKILYRTVDLMWKSISDPSTDFNFYTKRMTLAAVYTSSFLYWLNDDSQDDKNTSEYKDTWAFLDRRIENVMQFEKTKAKCKKLKFPDIWRELGIKRYGR